MITNIQIAYSATAAAAVKPTTLQSAMSLVFLPTGANGDITQIADVTLLSDTTTIAGSVVTRTLNFTPGAQFPLRFPPAGDQAAPFRQLYTAILANALSTKVTAADPVLT